MKETITGRYCTDAIFIILKRSDIIKDKICISLYVNRYIYIYFFQLKSLFDIFTFVSERNIKY